MLTIQTKNQYVIDFIKQHLPEGFNDDFFKEIKTIEIVMSDDCSIVNIEESKKEEKMIREKMDDMCSINFKF